MNDINKENPLGASQPQSGEPIVIDTNQVAVTLPVKEWNSYLAYRQSKNAGLPLGWTNVDTLVVTSGVLIFATVVLLLLSKLLYNKNADGQQILKCFGLVLIITFSALLLIVGYNKDDLTPIIGLFGAIAGYLLGKESGSKSESTRGQNETGK